MNYSIAFPVHVQSSLQQCCPLLNARHKLLPIGFQLLRYALNSIHSDGLELLQETMSDSHYLIVANFNFLKFASLAFIIFSMPYIN